MKSTLEPSAEVTKRGFPCLMESKNNGTVFLFTSEHVGTVVYPCPRNLFFEPLGSYHTKLNSCFEEWCWKPFIGTVALKNDK